MEDRADPGQRDANPRAFSFRDFRPVRTKHDFHVPPQNIGSDRILENGFERLPVFVCNHFGNSII